MVTLHLAGKFPKEFDDLPNTSLMAPCNAKTKLEQARALLMPPPLGVDF